MSKLYVCPYLLAQMVKNLPATQETQVRSLGQEDTLEKGMAPHSSILAWRIPWMEEPGGLQSMGSQRVGHSWVTNTFTFSCPYLMSQNQMCLSLWTQTIQLGQHYSKTLLLGWIFSSGCSGPLPARQTKRRGQYKGREVRRLMAVFH